MSEQTTDQKNQNGDKPAAYFNGFTINNTLVDFQIQISVNGNALESYNMAPVTAKNLALQLLGVVEKYELLTGIRIDSFNELKEKTQKKMEENEELKKEAEKKEKEQKEKDESAQKT
jgi:sensor histidine kinase YesM